MIWLVLALVAGCLDEQPHHIPGRFTWAELESCPEHVGCPVAPTLAVATTSPELEDGWLCDDEDARYRHCAEIVGCGEAIAFGTPSDTIDSGIVIEQGPGGVESFWTWEGAPGTRFVVMPHAGIEDGELWTYRVEQWRFPAYLQVTDVTVGWGDKHGTPYPMYRVKTPEATYWIDVAQPHDAGGRVSYHLPSWSYINVEDYNVFLQVDGNGGYSWGTWENVHHAAC